MTKSAYITLTFGVLMLLLIGFATYMGKTAHNKQIENQEKVEDDFLKVPTYSSESVFEEDELKIEADGTSYWFVVCQTNSGTYYNTMLKQEHSYFSVGEAKAAFKEKVFINNFIRVDKLTYQMNQ